MHRGSIAVGAIHCDKCGRTVKHPERYLLISQEDDAEGEGKKMLRYCVACCLKLGYAQYKKVEKGEQILTFFVEETGL